jgi:hypothetical protein
MLLGHSSSVGSFVYSSCNCISPSLRSTHSLSRSLPSSHYYVFISTSIYREKSITHRFPFNEATTILFSVKRLYRSNRVSRFVTVSLSPEIWVVLWDLVVGSKSQLGSLLLITSRYIAIASTIYVPGSWPLRTRCDQNEPSPPPASQCVELNRSTPTSRCHHARDPQTIKTPFTNTLAVVRVTIRRVLSHVLDDLLFSQVGVLLL